MREAGFEPDCQIVADGKLHHFRDWLDRPDTLNGWYVFFPDSPASGAFGCCRRGISERWSEFETIRVTPVTQFASIKMALRKAG
jgi:putative DNA primase/helicase